MLKRRIIPVQLLLHGRLVKTRQFDAFRDVGDPISSSRVYNSQAADELIFLNIDRDVESVRPLAELMERVSEVCFMPLSVGGGIRSAEDAAFLIRNGADKIVVNSAAYDDPSVVAATADRFGRQAVVVAIDVRREDQDFALFSHCGRHRREIGLAEHLAKMIELGAGEILIQSVDRDGTMEGYDIDLIRTVRAQASVPVIALGGSGNYEHLKAAFLEGNVSAVACGSLFNFSDSNPIRAKAFLSNYGLPFKVV